VTARARDPRPERTRAAIVEAALTIVGSGQRFSMTSLARAAGVSRSSLYAQFPDVDEIAIALLVEVFDEIGRADAIDRTDTGVDVSVIAQRAALRLAEHLDTRRPFYRAVMSRTTSGRVFHELALAYSRTVEASIAISNPDQSPEARHDLALFAGGGAMAILVDWLMSPDDPSPESLARRLLAAMPSDVVGHQDLHDDEQSPTTKERT
jgi:AcrR family transcriptional regulator